MQTTDSDLAKVFGDDADIAYGFGSVFDEVKRSCAAARHARLARRAGSSAAHCVVGVFLQYLSLCVHACPDSLTLPASSPFACQVWPEIQAVLDKEVVNAKPGSTPEVWVTGHR